MVIQEKRKIGFVIPGMSGRSAHPWLHKMPSIGAFYMATVISQEEDYEVRVFMDSIIALVDRHGRLTEPYLTECDLICVSIFASAGTPWAFQIIEAIIRARSAKNRRTRFILGGSAPSAMPEYFLSWFEKFGSQVQVQIVIGPGEGVIIEAIEDQELGPIIKGFDRQVHLDNLPIPDFDLCLGLKSVIMNEMYGQVPITTSVGCHKRCYGCSAWTMRREICIRSSDSVIEEMLRRDQEGYNYFFLTDEDPNLDPNSTLALLNDMMTKGPGLSFDTQVTVETAAHEELVKLMAAAGCRWMLIGFEGVTKEALIDYGKPGIFPLIEQAADLPLQYGINIHGMFVFGGGITPNIFRKTLAFCDRHPGIISAQFHPLVPIPGSRLFKDELAAQRILTRRLEWFDFTKIVSLPRGDLSLSQLFWGLKKLNIIFYLLRKRRYQWWWNQERAYPGLRFRITRYVLDGPWANADYDFWMLRNIIKERRGRLRGLTPQAFFAVSP